MLKFTLFLQSLVLIFSNSIAQKYNAEVLEYNTTCQVIDNQLLIKNDIKIQINNRAGDHHGSFAIPYSKNEKITELTAYIADVSGNLIRKLKKDDIIDRSTYTNSLYEDHFKKTFQLKHSTYPYIVYCSYTTSSKNFFEIADWSPDWELSIPTNSASLSVIIPKNYKINYKNLQITEPLITKNESSEFYLWKSPYIPVKDEMFSRPSDEIPRVIVEPVEFKYWLAGNQSTWKSFGDWIYMLGQDVDNVLPESEQKELDKIIAGKTDKKEIARALYHYLQDRTRYVNVTIGVGGFRPYPAGYVSLNKYGDCKALTNYMKALLKYAGIESYYSIIYAGDIPQTFIEDLPHNQFNHVILAVPLEKDTIWLENTNKNIPFDYLGTFTQNRTALLIDLGKSKLIKTPSLKKNEVCEVQNLKYTISGDKSAEIEYSGSFRGSMFLLMNSLLSDVNEEDKDRIIRKIVKFDNAEITDWKLNKAHRDSAGINLSVKLRNSIFLKALGNDYYFNANSADVPEFTNPANRKLPVIIPYPVVGIDTLNFILPDGLVLKSLPANSKLSSEYGNFEQSIFSDKNTITVIKSFQLFPGNYSLEQYPDFYNFIESARKADAVKIVVKQITL
ncbi:MAG TPA: DUF3857 domain-containing protein [Lentimicrobium sp.]|nr:DUF3857 domain-containing protein [Lentimicrobium sp.]